MTSKIIEDVSDQISRDFEPFPVKNKPGRKKGWRKLDPKSADISGVRCHPEFKAKMLDHIKTVNQKESEWKLEAFNYYINLQRGDIK